MTLLTGEESALDGMEAFTPFLAATEIVSLRALRDRQRARLRAHAYVLLRRLLKLEPEEAPVTYFPDGKPHIQGSSFDISISHKNERVAVGIVNLPDRIGVDVEDLEERIDPELFARFVLSESESRDIKRLPLNGREFHEKMIAYWSAKEAFFKCVGHPFRPKEVSLEWSADFTTAHVAGCSLSLVRSGRWVRTVCLLSND